MSERPIAGRNCATPPRRWIGFRAWLANQAFRSDDVGWLARQALATGEIDQTNLERLHKAIAEWATAP